MMKMLSKTLLFALLFTTAWSYPQDHEYDDYEYEEENIEYGDPPEFQLDSQNLMAKEGESLVIPCQSTQDNSNTAEPQDSPYVTIIKKAPEGSVKEKLIFVGDLKVLRDRRYKMLNPGQVEISNLKRTDSGTYICSLQSQPPLEVTHTVDIQYAPKIISFTEEEQVVHKGEAVKLECKAEGNPVPSITWSRQDGPLPSGATEEEQGLSITLAEVDRHVEGSYVCTANNGIGDPVSAVMSVVVEYEPEIITEKDMIRTDEGETVELVCIVHARPPPRIDWSKDGAALTIDSHIEEQQNGGHRNSIKISQISEADFGDYVCTAENTYGVAESTLSLSGVPKPPHFTSDPNGGEETSYTLTWDTESYYPITQYRLKYRKAKANDSTDEPGEWMDMTYEVDNNLETKGLTHSMKHTLDELEAATDYHASVQVKNQFMWGDSAEFSFSTRKEVAQQNKGVSGASSVCFSTLLLLVPALLLRT